MSYRIHHQTDLETETCCSCGVLFAMPAEMQRNLRQDGKYFYCPNGHSQHYTETMQKKLDEAQRQLRESKCETMRERQLRELAEKKLKRVARGVCPCCKRSFQNLQAHMKTKHPEQLAPL